MQDVLGDATPADLAAAWRLAYAICGETAVADAAAEAAVAAQVSWLGPPSPVELLSATYREVEPVDSGLPGATPQGGDPLLDAWWELPVDQRAALWLHVADGRPSEIAASILSLAPGAVVSLADTAQDHLIPAPADETCPGRSELTQYEKGGLPARETTAVRRHLATCATCQDRQAAVQRLLSLGDPETGPVPMATDAGRQALDLCLLGTADAWDGDLIDDAAMVGPEPSPPAAAWKPPALPAPAKPAAPAAVWTPPSVPGSATPAKPAVAAATWTPPSLPAPATRIEPPAPAPTTEAASTKAPSAIESVTARLATSPPPTAPRPASIRARRGSTSARVGRPASVEAPPAPPIRPAPKGSVAVAALAAFRLAMGEEPAVVDEGDASDEVTGVTSAEVAAIVAHPERQEADGEADGDLLPAAQRPAATTHTSAGPAQDGVDQDGVDQDSLDVIARPRDEHEDEPAPAEAKVRHGGLFGVLKRRWHREWQLVDPVGHGGGSVNDFQLDHGQAEGTDAPDIGTDPAPVDDVSLPAAGTPLDDDQAPLSPAEPEDVVEVPRPPADHDVAAEDVAVDEPARVDDEPAWAIDEPAWADDEPARAIDEPAVAGDAVAEDEPGGAANDAEAPDQGEVAADLGAAMVTDDEPATTLDDEVAPWAPDMLAIDALWADDDDVWAAYGADATPPTGTPAVSDQATLWPVGADRATGTDDLYGLLLADDAPLAAETETASAIPASRRRRHSRRRAIPPAALTPKVLATITAGVLAAGIVGAIIVHPKGLPHFETVRVGGGSATSLFPKSGNGPASTVTTPNSDPLVVISPGPMVSTTGPKPSTTSSSTSTTTPTATATTSPAATGGYYSPAPTRRTSPATTARTTPTTKATTATTVPKSTTTTSTPCDTITPGLCNPLG